MTQEKKVNTAIIDHRFSLGEPGPGERLNDRANWQHLETPDPKANFRPSEWTVRTILGLSQVDSKVTGERWRMYHGVASVNNFQTDPTRLTAAAAFSPDGGIMVWRAQESSIDQPSGKPDFPAQEVVEDVLKMDELFIKGEDGVLGLSASNRRRLMMGGGAAIGTGVFAATFFAIGVEYPLAAAGFSLGYGGGLGAGGGVLLDIARKEGRGEKIPRLDQYSDGLIAQAQIEAIAKHQQEVRIQREVKAVLPILAKHDFGGLRSESIAGLTPAAYLEAYDRMNEKTKGFLAEDRAAQLRDKALPFDQVSKSEAEELAKMPTIQLLAIGVGVAMLQLADEESYDKRFRGLTGGRMLQARST